jgi:MoxR-like ATPase
MNMSREKLTSLWNKVNVGAVNEKNWVQKFIAPLRAEASVVEYAQNLFDALDAIWGYDLPQALRASEHTAIADDCAVGIHDGGSDEVYRRLLTKSDKLGLKEDREKCRNLVWGKLSGIKGDRDSRFRVSSNSDGFSTSETFNTTCCMMNPDPWVYSYNYPWHIIAWMKDVHNGQTPRKLTYENIEDEDRYDDVSSALNYRFIFKYLWMISCQDVIPILSLRSFVNLLPFFKETWPDVAGDSDEDFDKAFGIDENIERWKMSKADFDREWRKLSNGILSVFGIDGTKLGETRLKLAAFLFAVSLTESSQRDLETLLEKGNKAVVLYGPPGTGKTRAALHYAFGVLGIDYMSAEKIKKVEEGRLCYQSEQGELTLVQFHPNYSYQDFVGGIFPGVDPSTRQVFYEIKEGIFKKVCDKASKKENSNKKYYIIIDEINRADLSSVFGELMYGLEYRNFPMNIPTFGEFTIPSNVYLIGTMNNTDKSLVGFDLALRRRFAFLKIPPNMSVLADESFISAKEEKTLTVTEESESQEDGAIDVAAEFKRRAEKLNEQMSTLLHLPEEKRIGHAYFLRVKDFCKLIKRDGEEVQCYVLTPFALEQLWTYHILPLLEEYIGLEFDDRLNEITTMKEDLCAEF